MNKNASTQPVEQESSPRPKTIGDTISLANLNLESLPAKLAKTTELIHGALLRRKGVHYRGFVDELSWRSVPTAFEIPEPQQKSFSMRTEKLPGAVVVVPWSQELGIDIGDYVGLLSGTDEAQKTFSEMLGGTRKRLFLVLLPHSLENSDRDQPTAIGHAMVFLDANTLSLSGAENDVALARAALGELRETAQEPMDIQEHIAHHNAALREKEHQKIVLQGPFSGLPAGQKALEIIRWASVLPAAFLIYILAGRWAVRLVEQLANYLDIVPGSAAGIGFGIVMSFCTSFVLANIIISFGFRWIPRSKFWVGVVLFGVLAMAEVLWQFLAFMLIRSAEQNHYIEPLAVHPATYLFSLAVGIAGITCGYFFVTKDWLRLF